MSIYHSLIPFNNPFMKKLLNWRQSDEEDNWRQKALEAITKKLKKTDPEQYTNLETALRRKCEDTPCVPLSRSQDGRLQVSHRKMLPQVMCCRVFRWPDLQSQHELKSLPRCQYPVNRTSAKVCLNPYHYARVDHSLYPPVVTPRSESEFIDASPPPQSPLSPCSTYSQQGSPASCFQQIPQPAHEHNNPYNPQPAHTQYRHDSHLFDQASFNSLNNHHHNLRQQNQGQPMTGFAYSSQSPTSEGYFVTGPNGEPISTQLNGSPQASQPFDSQTPPPRYVGRPDHHHHSHSHQQALMPMDTEDAHQSQHQNMGLNEDPWCRILYFELNQKIGEPFKSSSSVVFVDGFTNPSIHNRRFSLGVLSNINRNSTIELTRRAIRKGICLENQEDQIFVQNLSESSIFFHSKNCNVENQLNHHAVVKIETGKRQKVFDQKVFEGIVQEARMSPDGNSYDRLFALTEHCIIKMSFVKGWGSIYQRQDVTSTPCWIEICLLKPYALLDQYLQETKPFNRNITSTS